MILDSIQFDNIYGENVGDYIHDCKQYFFDFSLNIKHYADNRDVVFFDTKITKCDFVKQNIENYTNMLDIFFNYIAYQYISIMLYNIENLSHYNLSLLCCENRIPTDFELNNIQNYELLKPYLVKLFLFNSIKYLEFNNSYNENYFDDDNILTSLEITLNYNSDKDLNFHLIEILNFLKQYPDLFVYDFDNNPNHNLDNNAYLIIAAKK